MKKFILAILAVICVACGCLAAACTTKYYTLTIKEQLGVTVVCDAKDGAQVQQGYEITFTLKLDDKTEGEPVVKVNDTALTPDGSGIYKFKMNGDTVIEVTGVTYTGETTVTFTSPNSDFLYCTDLEGNRLTTLSVARGDEVQFKTHVSIYYNDFSISVVAGSRVLEAVDGVYTLTANESVTVKFTGLPDDVGSVTFLGRNEGDGSREHPFIIKTPLDLWALSYKIGDGYTDGDSIFLHTAYYVLGNDIDMHGEKLYVIGDGRTGMSVFAGVFDGNGHTISNYYMDDVVIDQTTYEQVKLTCVGLFGQTIAYEGVPSGVYNLNLKNFTIKADGAALDTSLAVGGIAGITVGTTVSNCTVEGTLTVDANSSYFGYVGGLVGFQQSAYNEETGLRALSVVQSSSSKVTIMGTSGYVLTAGGITGTLYAIEDKTTAAILNCYSDCDISGAMRVGGIAGMITPFSSVKNCYSYGYIEANSALESTPGLETYSFAYAGGIVGFAENDSIISDSYSTAECSAYSRVTGNNNSDGILGHREAKANLELHSEEAIVLNCHSTQNSVYGKKVSSVDDAFLKNTLGWDAADWHFGGDGKPTTEQEASSKTFTVTVQYNGGSQSLSVTDEYYPMATWYIGVNGKHIDQYQQSGAMRSYGYYFDEELKVKVPFGYIPTGNTTVYAKLVDYSEVAGTYHLSDGAYFVLDENGYIMYHDGALYCVSTYYYNGETLVLENTFFAILINENFGFYTYIGEADGATMKIYARPYSYTDSNTNQTWRNYDIDIPLTAIKELDSFNYGSYYSADGQTSYTFNPDGTGIIERTTASGTTTTNFTYVLNGETLTVNYSGTTAECTVENGTVTGFDGADITPYDSFKGVWEKASSAHVQYTFDGKGGWSYIYYGYDGNGEKKEKQTSSGTYTVTDGVLHFDGSDKTAQINGENGLLYIDGEKYGGLNGFAGTWVFNKRMYTVELKLDGINSQGYGTGVITYSDSSASIEINYEVIESRGVLSIAIYYYYEGYGLLAFDPVTGTLRGEIYIASENAVISNIRFCMYDDFRGLWTADAEAFEGALSGKQIRFNGFGNYDFAGAGDVMKVKGAILIDSKEVGTYSLDEFTLSGSGSFTYKNKTYQIEFKDGVITVSCNGETSTLTQYNA